MLGEPLSHPHNVMAVAFHPDGSRLMTGCYDGTARMWDVKSHERIGEPLQIGSDKTTEEGKNQPVYDVIFNNDGSEVLTACANKLVQFWNADTLEPIGEPLSHQKEVYVVAFSPDGRLLVTGSFDNAAHLWDAKTRQPVQGLFRHVDWVMDAAFTPDSRSVITASPDGTARVWPIQASHILPHRGAVLSAVFSPNGKMLITGGDDQYARIWEAAGRRLVVELRHDAAVTAVAFHADGDSVFTGTKTGRMQRWKVDSGEPIAAPWQVSGSVHKIEHRNGGNVVLVRCAADAGEAVQLWDFQTGKAVGEAVRFEPSQFEEPFVFATSPDGKTVILKDSNASAQIWDLATGERRGQPLQHEKRLMDASFNDDGLKIVSVGYDQLVRVWDAQTGKPLGTPIRHGGIVRAAVFRPDGATVISASGDLTARLWSWQTGEPLGEALQHQDQVYGIRRSADDRVVLTLCRDGSAHLWNVEVCKPLARPLQFEDPVNDALFNRDGSLILFMCRDGTARIYQVPQSLPDNPQLIQAWARTQTGFESDQKGLLHEVSQTNWQQAQAECAELERAK
jgi:WD40 repeat protein